jgi:pimeloyl-ACP methyl ester carboxylesterase
VKEIYLISGLGADKRVFDYVNLSGYKSNHIEWVDPLNIEPIESYAERLLGQIHSTNPILIGVSFGGMIAVEIGKLIQTNKIILISSASTRLDIPFYFRIIGVLGINRIIPTRLLKSVNSLTFWFFGTKTKEEKELLTTIISETGRPFLKWSVDKIVNWKSRTRLDNLVHIHGTRDRILPIRTPDIVVENGGHLMILNRGPELCVEIKKIIG